MNVELKKMPIWFKVNKLSRFNKNEVNTFSLTKGKTSYCKYDLPILYIDNFKIVRESGTKLPGTYIYEKLSWKYDIKHVCNKASKIIGIMYKSINILSKRLMKQMYFSFIPSYLNFANIAWVSTNKLNLISLYRHQKHAIRKHAISKTRTVLRTRSLSLNMQKDINGI